MLENVLDNLFRQKDKTITGKMQENVAEDIVNPVEEKNATTEVGETNLSTEPVVEGVSEGKNSSIDVSEKKDKSNPALKVFIANLKQIVDNSQGLDFELLELKKRINELINNETHG